MTPAERGVILDALRLLELTRRSFKSKHVAAARKLLEGLAPQGSMTVRVETKVTTRRKHLDSRDCWCGPTLEHP